MAKKKLTFESFLPETLSEKPSKLFLSDADGLTEMYLEVLSSEHPIAKRAATLYAIRESDILKEANDLRKADADGNISADDRADSIILANDGVKEPRKELAETLVCGGNFENYMAVLANSIIVDAVIARAYDTQHYLEKKS